MSVNLRSISSPNNGQIVLFSRREVFSVYFSQHKLCTRGPLEERRCTQDEIYLDFHRVIYRPWRNNGHYLGVSMHVYGVFVH